VIRLKQIKQSAAGKTAGLSVWNVAGLPGAGPMSAESDHTTTLLIGGETVAGAGETIAVENPYTTETIVDLWAVSIEQVDAAVGAARTAWPRLGADHRRRALRVAAEIGRDHAGRVIPPIESSQLAMVLKDPIERKEWWYPYKEYGAS
jgi:aldehyde dehydrogenase family protein